MFLESFTLEQIYRYGIRHVGISFQVMFFCGFLFWYKLSFSLFVRRRSKAKGSLGQAYFWWASCQSKWSIKGLSLCNFPVFKKWL